MPKKLIILFLLLVFPLLAVSKSEIVSERQKRKKVDIEVTALVIKGETAKKIYETLKVQEISIAAEEMGFTASVKSGVNVSCRKIKLEDGKPPLKDKEYECNILVDSNGKITSG